MAPGARCVQVGGAGVLGEAAGDARHKLGSPGAPLQEGLAEPLSDRVAGVPGPKLFEASSSPQTLPLCIIKLTCTVRDVLVLHLLHSLTLVNCACACRQGWFQQQRPHSVSPMQPHRGRASPQHSKWVPWGEKQQDRQQQQQHGRVASLLGHHMAFSPGQAAAVATAQSGGERLLQQLLQEELVDGAAAADTAQRGHQHDRRSSALGGRSQLLTQSRPSVRDTGRSLGGSGSDRQQAAPAAAAACAAGAAAWSGSVGWRCSRGEGRQPLTGGGLIAAKQLRGADDEVQHKRRLDALLSASLQPPQTASSGALSSCRCSSSPGRIV